MLVRSHSRKSSTLYCGRVPEVLPTRVYANDMTPNAPRHEFWLSLPMLRLLVGIADHGSLSASARSAGIAQSNATRSLQTLERRLGYSLIHRSTQGSTLTEHGALTAQWARDALRAIDRFSAGAQALATTGVEELSIGASLTIAEYLLPEWIAAFRTSHPNSAVKLQVMNSANVIAAVQEANVILGFIETPQVPQGIDSAVVWHDELVAVVDPSHSWASTNKRIAIEELAGTPLVEREQGSGTRAFVDLRLGSSRPAPILELNSNTAICETVIQGIGPALLSRLAVASYLQAGQLVEVPTRGRALERTLHGIWNSKTTLPVAAYQFLETSQQNVRTPGL